MSNGVAKIAGRAAGFTLVELLVALFITAILFAMGYGAVNQAMNNRGAVEDQNNRLLAVQTTLRLMAQDFEQAAPRAVRTPVGTNNSWEPAFQSQGSAQGSDQQAAIITLTRSGWANPAGIQRGTQERVSYVLEDKTLRRMHWPVLDRVQSTQPLRRELIDKVKSLKLRYMDGNHEWVEDWPSSATPLSSGAQPGTAELTRPLAVEVTMELEDWGKIVRIFEITQ